MRLGISIIIVALVVSAFFCLINNDTVLIKNESENGNMHDKDHNGIEFVPVFTVLIIFTGSLIINKLKDRQEKKKEKEKGEDK